MYIPTNTGDGIGRPDQNCILNKPLLLYIPPGQHHIQCPVHPNGHDVYGPEVTC